VPADRLTVPSNPNYMKDRHHLLHYQASVRSVST